MKVLALTVILANIVLFLWEYHTGALVQHDLRQDLRDPELQALVLVSEALEKLENKAAWQAPVVRERARFVSDYFQTQLVQGRIAAETYELLPDNPVTVPGAELDTEIRLTGLDEPRATQRDQAKPTRVGKASLPMLSAVDSAAPSADNALTVGAQDALPNTSTSRNAEFAQAVVTTPEAIDVAQDKPLALCYQAGPFANNALLKQWRRQTGIAEKFIKPVQQEEPEVTGYLVYYPAPENFEQALANVDMLKKKGVSDLWLFRKGDFKGEISLGLFKNKQRAEMLQQQFSDKAIQVLVRPRFKNTKKLYARISITPEFEDNLIKSRELWQQQHPEFTIKVDSDCIAMPHQ
ncbi:MAG: hypothetical protein CVV13_07195 [Gammaproteobacteria bacterium HGW-Gammaproteobacteria-3]|nr:MAG: hypothetical protein CVV13_07195 [Gammaproteobacteria bacterium HGW-Gammaproteobacteria-3]